MTITTDPHVAGQPNHDEAWWLAFLSISEGDYDRADNRWRDHASLMFSGLLSLEGFTFDVPTQQYHRNNGRVVDDDEIRVLFLAFLASTADEMEQEAGRMARGKITLGEWQLSQAVAVKDLYIASAALGVGGLPNLTDADLKDVRGEAGENGLKDAVVRLRRFADQIDQNAETAGTVKQIVHRAGQYALPAHTIHEEARRAAHLRAVDAENRVILWEESNNLSHAEHCMDGGFTTGCIECTQAGWVDLGTLPPPGERTCNVHCKCWMSYRVKPPATLSDVTDKTVFPPPEK